MEPDSTALISDDERQRRFQEGLCGWCAESLPADAAYAREFCGATCRQRNHRAFGQAGVRQQDTRNQPWDAN